MAEVTVLSLTEVANHGQGDDLWVCIHGYVYNVSKFVEEHPGGEEVLRAFAGKDATEAFEDAAHSEEVKAIMEGLLVGQIPSLQKANVTLRVQTRAEVISPQNTVLNTKQSRVVRQYLGIPATIVLGLLFSITMTLRMAVLVPGFAFFVVVGIATPIALLLYGFMAVTSRYQGAEDYPDYIKTSLAC